MNKVTALFAITTVSLAVTSVYLARSLHVERARFAAVVSAEPVLSTPASDPQQQRPTTVSSKPAEIPTNGATAPLTPNKPTAQSSGSSEPTRQVVLPPRVRNRSPRSADLAYRRLELQKQYPDLVTVLNLQPDEAARFFDLLAQQQLNDAEDEVSSMRSGDSSGRERERERERQRQANRAEQAALLGEARMADWNRYMNSLGARAEIRELRTLLADSDYLLRRDQYEPLVALLATEQVRHNDEREQLRRSMRDPTNPTPEEAIKYMGQRMDLIEESLERRRRAVTTILDNEQLRRYQTLLELERLRGQVEYDSTVTAYAEAAQEKSKAGR